MRLFSTAISALLLLSADPLSAQGDNKKESAAADAALHAFSAADTTGRIWTTGGVFNITMTDRKSVV